MLEEDPRCLFGHLYSKWYVSGMNSNHLGNSQCVIYSGMLSLLYQVAEQNQKITPVVQLPTSIRLPVCFRDQSECKNHESLILSLAKLAFETLFCIQSEPLLVFPSSQMEICGMSAQEMEQCLSVGILTESEAVGISTVTRYKTVAFISPTFHEFLAALHIAVQCSTAKGEVPKELSDEIFANVYDRCRTFNEILSHSTIFKFLFGMDPMVGKKISEHVQKIVVEERDRLNTLAFSSVHSKSMFSTACGRLINETNEGVHSKSMFSTACGRLINETNEGVHRLNAMFLDWIEEGKKSGHENIQIVCSEITDLVRYNYIDPLHVKTITFFWEDLAICSPIKHSGPLEGLHIIDCSSVDLMKETIVELIVRSKETLTTLHLGFEDVTRGPFASKDFEAFLNPLCQISTLQNVALTNLSVSHSYFSQN